MLLWGALSIFKLSVDLEGGDECQSSASGHLWPQTLLLLCSHPLSLVEQGMKPVGFLGWKDGRPAETWVHSFTLPVSTLILCDGTPATSYKSLQSLLINSQTQESFPERYLAALLAGMPLTFGKGEPQWTRGNVEFTLRWPLFSVCFSSFQTFFYMCIFLYVYIPIFFSGLIT